MRPPKVIYLLGAGASANVIKPSEGFIEYCHYISTSLGEIKSEFINSTDISIEQIDKIFRSYGKFVSGIVAHYSFDTFAKILFDQSQLITLEEFKKYLQLTLLMVEVRNGNRHDNRYDNFLTSLRISSIKPLAETEGIITWNYDLQLERALYYYFRYSNYRQLKEDYFGCNTSNRGYNLNNTRIIKLNGSIDIINNYGSNDILFNNNLDIDSTNRIDLSKSILSWYKQVFNQFYGDKVNSGIKFAWEKQELEIELDKYLSEYCSEATSLVCVGYSFPDTNRKIDSILISKMKKLNKIIIQSLDPDEIETRLIERVWSERVDPKIKNNFFRNGNYDFTKKKSGASFVIPSELQ